MRSICLMLAMILSCTAFAQNTHESPDSLIHILTEILRLAPENETYRTQRAKLYILQNQEMKALGDLDAVIRVNPDYPEALFYRAYIYRKQRLYTKARQDYERLIIMQPRHRDARMGLVLVNDADGRPYEAMEQMDVLVRYWPDDPEVLIMRGGLYQKRREYEKALKDMNRAIELRDDVADFYISRALLYKDFKQTSRAHADIRKAVELGADRQECANLMIEDKVKKKKKKD